MRMKHFRIEDDQLLDKDYMNLLYGIDMSKQDILYIPKYIDNLLRVKDKLEGF